MDFLYRRIERQIFSLTGLSLGGIDYENPPGDRGLFGPQSICWQVHGDFPAMLCGGISALMLQMLHPLALAGVWDHSNFRDDMLGRLRRTSQFIAGTTFGATADAQRLIDRVRRIHDQVRGTSPDGRPYAANDPELLRWVHVAEVHSFLEGYRRYGGRTLSGADQDRYYDEVAVIGEALGATDLPRSRQAVAAYLDRMRFHLRYDQRTAEVLSLVLSAPAPNRLTKPVGYLVSRAAIDLLPEWAAVMAGLRLSLPRRQLIRLAMDRIAPVLRAALRDGASQRARRRFASDR